MFHKGNQHLLRQAKEGPRTSFQSRRSCWTDQDGGDMQFFEIRDTEGHLIEICKEQ
jgi:hypothetical protein